jgi:hypothetical protein
MQAESTPGASIRPDVLDIVICLAERRVCLERNHDASDDRDDDLHLD